MSVCFLFVFVGIADLNAPETLMIGCVGHGGAMPLEVEAAAQAVPGGLQHSEHGNRGDAGILLLPLAGLQRFEHIGPLLLIATGLAYYL
jgi:hypothetical protein